MNQLATVLEHFSNVTIGVFGDIMLDDFTYGSVNRISPEAPVPVVEAEFTEYKLGGCGNVASNITALGADVYLFSVVGDDAASGIVSSLLAKQKIHDMTIKDPERPTIRKNRIIVQKQQIARIDWEKKHSIPSFIEAASMRQMYEVLDRLDIIVISDYAKGFLTDGLCRTVIDTAAQLGKMVIVDPKAPFSKYKGASVITPNFKEFLEYGKIKSDRAPKNMFPYARGIIQDNNIGYVLVTMGEDGMLLFENDKYTAVKAVKNGLDIIDVTGAGDTVVSVYALGLAAGASYYDALRLANYAAGVVVAKFGTATCSMEELSTVMKSHDLREEVIM